MPTVREPDPKLQEFTDAYLNEELAAREIARKRVELVELQTALQRVEAEIRQLEAGSETDGDVRAAVETEPELETEVEGELSDYEAIQESAPPAPEREPKRKKAAAKKGPGPKKVGRKRSGPTNDDLITDLVAKGPKGGISKKDILARLNAGGWGSNAKNPAAVVGTSLYVLTNKKGVLRRSAKGLYTLAK